MDERENKCGFRIWGDVAKFICTADRAAGRFEGRSCCHCQTPEDKIECKHRTYDLMCDCVDAQVDSVAKITQVINQWSTKMGIK